MTTALPDFPVTTHPDMLPVRFEAPPVNPAPGGLYSSVFWTDVGTDEASRHLTGVEVRGANFPGDQVGVWDTDWCGVPALDGDRKEGERGGVLDPFDPLVVWAFDSCDATEPSRRGWSSALRRRCGCGSRSWWRVSSPRGCWSMPPT